MLQFIREKSQGWIAWTIVIIICMVFALWGAKTYLYSNQSESTVAKVNGVQISQRDFSSAYNQLKRQQQISLGANYSLTKQKTQDLKQAALQSLVSNIVLNQSAESLGFFVAPELVEATLARMPIFQVNGEFSKERFSQILNGMLFTPDEFFEQLQNNILETQIKSGVVETAFSTSAEINQAIQLIQEKRQFKYLIVPMKKFLLQAKLPKDAALDYYQKHQNEFELPEKVSIEYLSLSVKDLMNQIHPTPEQLQLFYQNNISSYTEPKQWKLAHILIALPMQQPSASDERNAKKKADQVFNLLKQGKDFQDLAKQYSDDDVTARQGGSMPWANSGQLDPVVRSILGNLKNPGDVVPPIKTGRGYEIVKLLEIKPAKVLPYSAVKNKVIALYQEQHAEQQFSDLSDQLANITYESPNSLSPAVKKLKLNIHTTGLFTKSMQEKQGILHDPKIVAAAFTDEVLQGNNSDPINLNDDTVVVLRVKQHIPPKIVPFNQVQSKIITNLTQEAAKKQAESIGEDIISALKQKKSLDTVAKQYGLTWQNTGFVPRHTQTINGSVLLTAFQSYRPSQAEPIVYSGSNLPSGDYVVIALTAVQLGKVSDLDQSKYHVFVEGLGSNYGLLDYQLLVNGLMNKAKIVHYAINNENQDN